MKSAAVAAMLFAAGAQAFVPSAPLANKVAKSSKMTMEFAGGMIGAAGPEPGSKNFDPLGFSSSNPERLMYYREAEIKHGRIAMLAVLGMIVPGKVPVAEFYQGVSLVDAHNVMVEKGPMVQLLFWLGILEMCTIPTIIDMGKDDRKPGDFGFDPLGLGRNADKLERYSLAELKNGRLAMLAFSGMITQAVLTGNDFPFLY
ncbi:unnamed protein product [Heterosigma akashiwo]|mmetsp:Transcript_25371/g.40057  ORF Transcript_25371/g.40057 Transcript_25371/m.40057 type:complete len:201 (+) Transcript_25371:217-819(+)